MHSIRFGQVSCILRKVRAISLELLRFFVPRLEVLLSLLPVEFEEVGIEVGRISGQRLVSPGPSILVIDDSNESLFRLISVPFELIRQWSLHGCLNFLDLIATVANSIIVEDLPLLHVTLNHVELFVLNAVLAENLFNNVLASFQGRS